MKLFAIKRNFKNANSNYDFQVVFIRQAYLFLEPDYESCIDDLGTMIKIPKEYNINDFKTDNFGRILYEEDKIEIVIFYKKKQ